MGPNLIKDTEGLKKELQKEWYGALQVTLHGTNDSNHVGTQAAVICISIIHTHQRLQLYFQSISSLLNPMQLILFYFLSFLSLELPSAGQFSSS